MAMRVSGLKAYRWQRWSAWALAVYFPTAVAYLAIQPVDSYERFVQMLSAPWFLIPTLLVLALLLVHMWVGVRDVLMDYLPALGYGRWLYAALSVWAVVLGLVAADLLYLLASLLSIARL